MANDQVYKFELDFGSLPSIGEGFLLSGRPYVVRSVVSTTDAERQAEIFIESIQLLRQSQ
jgi:hypothetical protein